MALVRGGAVLPHVQAFADAVAKAAGAESFGTYPGHDPTEDRALDIFVPVSSDVLGNKIAAFAIANLDRFGIWYLIYRQRIYNPKIASYWRAMERRGDPNVFDNTANHFDHVHVSFEATAPGIPTPTPAPAPTPAPPTIDKEALPMSFTYIAHDEDFVYLGTEGFFGRLPYGETLDGLKGAKVLADLGHQTDAFHAGIVALADTLHFLGDRA